ncbi:hypothetical protein [Sphingomonas sp.]|uniref:hypothetical protein n=1 Tax=Sphingomonas sp. TaxID=28214 RepID=UPI00258EC705|nr:hypothetical protein [Sphingomonas sp.]
MKAPALLTLAALTLAGCARDTRAYPSLAPRAVEEKGFAEPKVQVAVAKPDPALDARIGALRGTLSSLARGFAEDAAKADSAADRARGVAAGSDSWLDAQTALAQLDDWRAQTSSLLTDVDLLAAERGAQLSPPYPALGSLRDAIAAEADQQAQTIARIQARLARA